MKTWGQSALHKGNSKYKVPKVGTSLAHSRNRNEALEAGQRGRGSTAVLPLGIRALQAVVGRQNCRHSGSH